MYLRVLPQGLAYISTCISLALLLPMATGATIYLSFRLWFHDEKGCDIEHCLSEKHSNETINDALRSPTSGAVIGTNNLFS